MKRRKSILTIVSLTLATVLTLGVAGGCKKNTPSGFKPVDAENYNYDRFDDNANFVKAGIDDSDWDGVKSTEITDGYEKGTSRAPQTSRYLGTVTPVKPIEEVMDEHEKYGVKEYPHYGTNLQNYTESEMMGIIYESRALTPYPTWKSANIYDAIDAEGYLLRNGERVLYSTDGDIGTDEEEDNDGVISNPDEDFGDVEDNPIESGSTSVNTQYNHRYMMLYKHTAALTMYGGGLSDDEPRIVKEISFLSRPGMASNQITGLYAPAGEVIKVEISEEDLRAAGGKIIVYIGQNYNLDQQVSMEWSGSKIKGSGLSRMSDILNKFEITSTTAYVGSFIGGPIYVRPSSNSVERNMTVKISGGVRYQHFILGATTEEEYNENAKSTAPYFDLEIYDSAVRFTTNKYAASGGLALKDFTYQNCTDAAILWDKISEVSTRVQGNGLTSTTVPVMIIGDCYIAAGAAFANPGRNGVVCPPSWLAEALNYNTFVNSGSWGTMHEYNHCWQGFGVGNGGEVTNNSVTLVSYSLYTRISAGRTAAVSWGNGAWNRFTDPSKSLGENLTISNANNNQKCYDLSLYATLLHNIGQDNYIEAARGGRESGSTVYYNNLVNATHYDMTYYFTKVLNYDIVESGGTGSLTKADVDAVKAKNYPMFVPVSSVYQVGRSIIYDNEKQYITTAQPFAYGSGEYVMDFNNHNNFKNEEFVSKNLVIPDGFTVKVVSVTQPENGKVEMLEDNYVKYTPANGENGLYSGNFRVKLRITKDDREFIVEDVDLVINLKQGNTIYRTTYIYDEGNVPETDALLNAAKNGFDFGEYSETLTRPNVCTQETNTQIWAAGRNYFDDVYDANSENYTLVPYNRTLQTMDGIMYFSNPGTYRFTLKGRGKGTLYLSYDNGQSWESAFTFDRTNTNANAYVATEYTEHEFTTGSNCVYFKVVLLVTKESDFFGVGVAAMSADGKFPAFANATAYGDMTVLNDALSKFESEYHFKNEYKYSYLNVDSNDVTNNELVSVNYNAWDNSLLVGNLFDGNSGTYFHTQGSNNGSTYITEEKPLELVVDLSETMKVNTVTFNGYKGAIGNNGMPVTFELYGSLSEDSGYFLLTEQTDMPATTKVITLSFDEATIKYYKLVVKRTDNSKYFAMNSIVFSYQVSFPNGTLVAPNDFCVRYVGNGWHTENALCSFGLIYKAGVGDSVELHFNGTRFAYFAYQSANYGTVDVYLDGQLIASDVDLSADKNVGSLAYIYDGDALSDGDHVLKIVGKSGTFNVDSFAYWN